MFQGLIACEFQIIRSMGPFPAGVILHSYLGSAEMVPEFAKLGAYFSFSGFLMSMKVQKAKRMLKAVSSSVSFVFTVLHMLKNWIILISKLLQVSSDRILLETDAPDALPNPDLDSLFLVDGDKHTPERTQAQGENSASNTATLSDDHSHASTDASSLPKETLNHPANIHNVCCSISPCNRPIIYWPHFFSPFL